MAKSLMEVMIKMLVIYESLLNTSLIIPNGGL